MALPSFLKRKPAVTGPSGDAASVERARTSARRRLIGAAVLLALGVIAFPLLFETQPRPIPVDIPIEIPRKDGLPPLAPPARAPGLSAGQAGALPTAASSPGAAPTSLPPAVARPAPSKAADAVASAPASAARADPVARPEAAATATPSRPASAAVAAGAPVPGAAGGRYVVQVGAFADAGAVRELRSKVEKLGLKTYTQVIETAQGKRIRVRVGPFATQEEAGKVLARLKAAQLPGAVLTL